MNGKWLLAALVMWLGLVGPAESAGLRCCFNCGHVVTPPPPPSPLPDDVCGHRLHLGGSGKSDCLVQQLLTGQERCERVAAAQRLGCRLLADFCQDSQVLPALIMALQCDPAWEVRYWAAWSIHRQKARTNESLVALYLAARLDPHYQVRYRANEALDILLVLHRANYKDLLVQADKLAAQLRGKYKPGSPQCRQLFQGTQVGPTAAPRQASITGALLLPPE